MRIVRLVQKCNLMAFFVPKSLDYVKSNDNESKYCYTPVPRLFPTQHCCDIFISRGSYKFWSTWEALFKQGNPLTSFRVYKSQLSKIMKFSLASIVALVALFSQAEAANILHCTYY